MNGKVLKVVEYNLEFGKQARMVNVFGVFRYLPNNNLYIIYKMTNKSMRIRGNRRGRGEGRQEKHSFSKMQTAKRRRRAAGNYLYKKAEKNSQ